MRFVFAPRSTLRASFMAPFGFSILELSIAVAILAIVSVLGLEVAAAYSTRRAYATTQDKIAVVDTAIKQFFKTYGRLPCPSVITDPMTVSTSGKEINCKGASGVSSGGVPFIDLGLPISAALDGYGSKLRYIVTNELTDAGTGINQFNSTASIGRIEVRTGKLQQPCGTVCELTFDPNVSTGAAYVILSHGADQRGAYSKNGTLQKTCAIANDTRIDAVNCGGSTNPVITPAMSNSTVVYDSRFNTGSITSSYFDDSVLARGKGDL